MKLQEAIEQAKVAFQETFGPEGYAHCRLEGWEDSAVCWIVILSAEFIPPAGTAAHTLSRLTGGRRIYRKVEVNKMNETAQGILPVPDPYAATRSTNT